ncbi:hypothetical protein ACIF8T_22895 [Streptomyces sp. NPDC085946]|uniref:hypothetical protein n=1 Tax=Streptomyces sp. NPDC085946 TaxID=3365744 RepID=UPI0037D99088
MNDTSLTLISNDGNNGEQPPGSNWFRILPPKEVRSRWARKLKSLRRPTGSLALPAIATTAGLHFTGTIGSGDSLMAFGLTSLVVGYDSVVAVTRTRRETAGHSADGRKTTTASARRAA